MEILRLARKALKLTLRELARTTEIPRQTLSDLESGLYLPTPQAAERLRMALRLPALPDSSQILTGQCVRRLAKGRPAAWRGTNQHCWRVLESQFAYQLRRSKVPKDLLEWMKLMLEGDSATECLCCCCLGGAGAKPVFANPNSCGYRRHPVLDRDCLPLGDHLLPGLSWQLDGKDCLFFPQANVLTLKGVFRLDLLALYDDEWFNVEIDGPKHRAEEDAYRREAIDTTEIRIGYREVRALRAVAILSEEFRARSRSRLVV